MTTDRPILKPLKLPDTLWRGLYGTTHGGSEYIVEVDYFDFTERIRLYCDGLLVDSKKSPAKFFLEDGSAIEAAMSLYGMKVARFTPPGKTPSRKLEPLPGTAESYRSALSRRFPGFNRCLSFAAWLVLATALVTQVPNLLNGIGHVLGFSVPSFGLPAAIDTFLGLAGIAAGLDRGLRMKHNPLLDD